MKSHYSYRWDRADLQGFYDSTDYLLQTIQPSTNLLADIFQDVNCPHGHSINSYYQSIIDALLARRATRILEGMGARFWVPASKGGPRVSPSDKF